MKTFVLPWATGQCQETGEQQDGLAGDSSHSGFLLLPEPPATQPGGSLGFRLYQLYHREKHVGHGEPAAFRDHAEETFSLPKPAGVEQFLEDDEE